VIRLAAFGVGDSASGLGSTLSVEFILRLLIAVGGGDEEVDPLGSAALEELAALELDHGVKVLDAAGVDHFGLLIRQVM
jgi:hypothetical protein